MFTVYHSNQVALLKSLLINVIQSQPLDNPFEKELILVQSPGMAQWLRIEMAKEQGILANVEFPLPATFIWQMFIQLLDDVPKRSYFNKEAMTWKLMTVLPRQLDDPDFAELKQYLANDEGQVKLFQLSGKIADIYDQYLVYRPEWINAWEAEQAIPELEDEPKWQGKLWRTLFDYTQALGQSQYHRANLYDVFIDTLESHQHRPYGLKGLKRVFIFGISALPPRYLQSLKALGKYVDIHYMFTNPCRYYWGDIRDERYVAKRDATQQGRISRDSAAITSIKMDKEIQLDSSRDEVGNSLLASMGKLGRDNLLLISSLECQEIDQGFVEINRDSLLHHIQADILDLHEPGDINEILTSHKKTEITLDDHSLMIEVCHSPMREVEVLHDRLLDMFSSNASLTPRDVIVMVADINAYSAAIQAVFGNAPGERFIPYSISDRTAVQESPILSTFLNLLSLPDSRCTANEILAILEIPAVQRRFGLDIRQFEKILFWVKEVGIRWGLDQHTAETFQLPSQHQNSWLFGLQRMLLGYAMPSEQGLFNGMLAYDEVQGLEADVAGKLAEFIQTIADMRDLIKEEKQGQAWISVLSNMLDAFFLLEGEEEKIGRLIRDQLNVWLEQLDEAGFDDVLSIKVVKAHLDEKLSGERISQRFLAGQVNFCTLMPMRSIPFSVVCLLGMNDGQYPRTLPPLGFDLMAGRVKAGDRSRRDDDRYLFLEAIQSAEHQIYISYVGRSVQDNTLKVPSVLVSELLDYCTQGYCLEGDQTLPSDKSAQRLIAHLSHDNPLVPFNPCVFEGDNPSYAAEWLPVAKGEGKQAQHFCGAALPTDDVMATDSLELDELQKFWRLPVKYFFNRRLKVYFEQVEQVIEEEEPFSFDHLERYQLQTALLTHLIKNGNSEESVHSFMETQRTAGQLPHGHFGDIALARDCGPTLEQFKRLHPFLNGKKPTLEIDLSLMTKQGEVRLQGWLDGRYEEGRVLYRSGNHRPQDLLSAWIDHLCQCGMGDASPTFFVSRDDCIKFDPLDMDDAKMTLTDFVETYFTGLNYPIPFFPKTAFEAITSLRSKDGEWQFSDDFMIEKAKQAMQKTFHGGYQVKGEKKNEYIERIWNELSEDLENVTLDLALTYYKKMLSTSSF